ITIDGERYSSLEESPLFVDGNTLCAYAAGDIDANAVKEVVQRRQEKAEIITDLNQKITLLEKEQRTAYENHEAYSERTSRRFGELLRLAENLKEVLSNYMFPGKAGREALQNWKVFMQPKK
ncbi:MAG: hypothetical protein Q7R63_01085, partial [bacterium]|nr:hypothetical protein [bacterium]